MAGLSELQLDALREVANIGCGHAATALSQLLGGRRIEIDVPTAHVARLDVLAGRLGGPKAEVVAVSLDMLGGARGHLQLALPGDSARALAGLLLGGPVPPGALSADARSAIAETGNILASAYLNAIGRAVGLTLIPSIPRTEAGTAEELLADAEGRLGGGQTLLLQTRFSDRGAAGSQLRMFFGHFLVIPDAASLPKMLAALGLG